MSHWININDIEITWTFHVADGQNIKFPITCKWLYLLLAKGNNKTQSGYDWKFGRSNNKWSKNQKTCSYYLLLCHCFACICDGGTNMLSNVRLMIFIQNFCYPVVWQAAYLSIYQFNMVTDKLEAEGKCQMFNMLHAHVIKAKISLFFFFFYSPLSMYNFGQKGKDMLDLSKAIISNSLTLIALRRWKASGLVSHILKLNVLLFCPWKKHIVPALY